MSIIKRTHPEKEAEGFWDCMIRTAKALDSNEIPKESEVVYKQDGACNYMFIAMHNKQLWVMFIQNLNSGRYYLIEELTESERVYYGLRDLKTN